MCLFFLPVFKGYNGRCVILLPVLHGRTGGVLSHHPSHTVYQLLIAGILHKVTYYYPGNSSCDPSVSTQLAKHTTFDDQPRCQPKAGVGVLTTPGTQKYCLLTYQKRTQPANPQPKKKSHESKTPTVYTYQAYRYPSLSIRMST